MQQYCTIKFAVSYSHTLVLALIPLLQGCQTSDYTTVLIEHAFVEIAVDKPLSWPGGYNVRFSSDGKISGQFPNGEVDGEWRWRDALFCRSIRIGNQPRPDECLQIEYNGEQIRFKRPSGDYFLPYRIGENTQ